MFCPQCGTESPADLKFCRTCGANLRVIGKAVTLSEAIARSDSVSAKIKDIVKNLKVEQVTDDVARAMEKVKLEIAQTADDHRKWHADEIKPVREKRKEKTAAQRREKHITQGLVTMFGGIGFALFLYFLAPALVGKFPQPIIGGKPFDIDSLLPIAWILGLMPTFTGLGHIIAGLTIRRDRAELGPAAEEPLRIEEPRAAPFTSANAFTARREDEATVFAGRRAPESVTDRTTNILDRQPHPRETDEIR